MTDGERLSAYLAGELDGDERAEVETALERDPELRSRLDDLRHVDEALRSLPRPRPSATFSTRLRDAVTAEIPARDASPTEEDELATRRRRRRTLAPVLAAAAAAAVIAVVGVSTGWVLRSASEHEDAPVAMEEAESASEPLPEVAVLETDNDFDEIELRRLAVNVDTQFVIHPETTREEAAPLGDRLLGRLLRDTEERDDIAEPESADPDEEEPEALPAADDPVARCLPTILDATDAPLVPAYVELARFEGERAVIYAFVTEEPASGTYRRVETWALSREDCEVLGFARYDRSDR